MLMLRVPLLYVLGASEETFVHASNYYIYLAIGAPFIMVSFIHSNLLRAEGMSKESMAGTLIGTVVNITPCSSFWPIRREIRELPPCPKIFPKAINSVNKRNSSFS